MNLVLADTEEFRRIKKKPGKQAPGSAPQGLVESEEKRTLGLLILRGTHIISTTVESPPPADPAARLGGAAPAGAAMAAGPGITKSAGRGVPIGLTGPAAGVGAGGFAGFGNQPPPGMGRGMGPGPPGFGGPPGFNPGLGRGFPGR